MAACQLHEVGLLLGFKQHQNHSGYIIKHAELPGFDQNERLILTSLVSLYKGDIKEALLTKAPINQQSVRYLLVMLRIATILCRRRKDDVLPIFHSKISNNTIIIEIADQWLKNHPLIVDELTQEHHHLSALDLSLKIQPSAN